MRPDKMVVKRFEGQKIYEYQTPSGKPHVFFQDELLHIPAFGFDGMIGYSRIALARNAIGLALSAEKFGSKFYANGLNVGLIYRHPTELKEAAYNRLKDDLKQKSGVAESSNPIILEEGMSIERIGIPPDDRQFLETRRFQLSEINRIMGPVPPHMIGDVTNSTSWGTGIDSQEQGYVNHTLRPYAVRIEQALNNQLMLPADREAGYFYEHLFDALLRGDIATRFEAYTKAINNGILSPNEVRSKENMNPYAAGDVYWRPMNMTSTADTTSAADTTAQAALNPLWRDAIARVMKREHNDVLGAVKRFAKKNDTAGLNEWIVDFYTHDHVAFMAKQFKPILSAHAKLAGVDITPQIFAHIAQYLNAHKTLILKMTAEEIDAEFENYDAQTEQFMDFLSGAMESESE